MAARTHRILLDYSKLLLDHGAQDIYFCAHQIGLRSSDGPSLTVIATVKETMWRHYIHLQRGVRVAYDPELSWRNHDNNVARALERSYFIQTLSIDEEDEREAALYFEMRRLYAGTSRTPPWVCQIVLPSDWPNRRDEVEIVVWPWYAGLIEALYGGRGFELELQRYDAGSQRVVPWTHTREDPR